jgi:iron complex transport system permease protein
MFALLKRMRRLLWVAGIGAAVVGTSTTVRDAAAETATGVSSPQRIVSIGGDITEIIYALGKGDSIVAIDTTSHYPQAAAATKKSVGYMRALSTEGVLSTNPDLIIASGNAGPPEVVAALKGSSIPLIEIKVDETPEGVVRKIEIVAEALGSKAAGEKLAEQVKNEFASVAAKRAKVTKPIRALFVLANQGGRIIAAGEKTSAEAMFAQRRSRRYGRARRYRRHVAKRWYECRSDGPRDRGHERPRQHTRRQSWPHHRSRRQLCPAIRTASSIGRSRSDGPLLSRACRKNHRCRRACVRHDPMMLKTMTLKTTAAALPARDRLAVTEPDRARQSFVLFAAAGGALLAMIVLSLSVGATGISLDHLPVALSSLFGDTSEEARRAALVLIDIRLPRTILAALVGACLAVSGAMMQGLFRNPLADPALIGVSSGAALAAVTVIVMGHGIAAPLVAWLGPHALPVAAFAGGVSVTGLLVLLAGGRRAVSIAALLLAGLVIGALAQALMGLIAYLSDDRELRDLTLWTLGSLAGSSWAKVIGVAPFALLNFLLLPVLVRALNGLLLGEAEAFHLGIDVERMKRFIIVATAASVAAAVAAAGIVGFVGIVVPHVVRLVAGPDHATLLPASAMLGAALLLAADVVARMVVAPAELPLGIVVALVGAPVFLHLVLRRGAYV